MRCESDHPDVPVNKYKEVPRPHLTCSECLYWQKRGSDSMGMVGQCRRRSPLPNMVAEKDTFFSGSTTHARWPETDGDHWCGESKTKMMTVVDED